MLDIYYTRAYSKDLSTLKDGKIRNIKANCKPSSDYNLYFKEIHRKMLTLVMDTYHKITAYVLYQYLNGREHCHITVLCM